MVKALHISIQEKQPVNLSNRKTEEIVNHVVNFIRKGISLESFLTMIMGVYNYFCFGNVYIYFSSRDLLFCDTRIFVTSSKVGAL